MFLIRWTWRPQTGGVPNLQAGTVREPLEQLQQGYDRQDMRTGTDTGAV
jgi:hypothetical protein